MRTRRALALLGLTGLIAGAGCASGQSAGGPSGTGAPGSSAASKTASSASAQGSPPAAAGVQESAKAIPWKAVGPGWLLAQTVSAVPAGAGVTTTTTAPITHAVYLVDPVGGRYLITSSPPGDLADWSGDTRRALFFATSGGSTEVSDLNIADGSIVGTFTEPIQGEASFSQPDGLAVLVSAGIPNASGSSLQRFGPDGSLQLSYPTSYSGVGAFDGQFLSTPDGTQLVMGAASGLALVANDGTVIRNLAFPSPVQFCFPRRWWSAAVVLVACDSPTGGGSRLWQVPLDGTTATDLTAPPVPPDSGDLNAWSISSGTYVEDAGGCGYVYLASLTSNGTTIPKTVPGVSSGYSTFVVGAAGDSLAIMASESCGSGQSLLWFDPSTNTATTVLGPPIGGGYVQAAVSYPGTG
jgi:hypothetical protein